MISNLVSWVLGTRPEAPLKVGSKHGRFELKFLGGTEVPYTIGCLHYLRQENAVFYEYVWSRNKVLKMHMDSKWEAKEQSLISCFYHADAIHWKLVAVTRCGKLVCLHNGRVVLMEWSTEYSMWFVKWNRHVKVTNDYTRTPTAVALDSSDSTFEYVYVAFHFPNSVHILNLEGKLVGQTEFNLRIDNMIIVDNEIWVAGRNEVVRLVKSNGDHISTLPIPPRSMKNGEPVLPIIHAIQPVGKFVAVTYTEPSNKILLFDKKGNLVENFKFGDLSPTRIVAIGDDRVLVSTIGLAQRVLGTELVGKLTMFKIRDTVNRKRVLALFAGFLGRTGQDSFLKQQVAARSLFDRQVLRIPLALAGVRVKVKLTSS